MSSYQFMHQLVTDNTLMSSYQFMHQLITDKTLISSYQFMQSVSSKHSISNAALADQTKCLKLYLSCYVVHAQWFHLVQYFSVSSDGI